VKKLNKLDTEAIAATMNIRDVVAGECCVLVELLFNKQIIQRQRIQISIESVFTNRRADITLVTHPETKNDRLKCWANWFNFLGLSFNVWSLRTYHTMFDVSDNWVGKCQVLLVEGIPTTTSINHMLRFADWKKHISKKTNTALFLRYESRMLDSLVYDFTQPTKLKNIEMNGRHRNRPKIDEVGVKFASVRVAQEEKDKDYLYAASAAIRVAKTGNMAARYGSYTLYKSLHKRHDRLMGLNVNGPLQPFPDEDSKFIMDSADFKVFGALVGASPAKGQLTALSAALSRGQFKMGKNFGGCSLSSGIVYILYSMVQREMRNATELTDIPRTDALAKQLEKKEFMEKLNPSTAVYASLAFKQNQVPGVFQDLFERIQQISSGSEKPSWSSLGVNMSQFDTHLPKYPANDHMPEEINTVFNRKWVEWVGRLQEFQANSITKEAKRISIPL